MLNWLVVLWCWAKTGSASLSVGWVDVLICTPTPPLCTMSKTALIVVSAALLAAAAPAFAFRGTLRETTDRVNGTGLCDTTVDQAAGYFDLPDASGGGSKHYFYWMFESRGNPSTDPLVIWMTGGYVHGSSLSRSQTCVIADQGRIPFLLQQPWLLEHAGHAR